MSGKCPKCESLFSSVKISDVSVDGGIGKKWHGIAYNCPSCGTTISVQIDPIALKADTVAELVKKIR